MGVVGNHTKQIASSDKIIFNYNVLRKQVFPHFTSETSEALGNEESKSNFNHFINYVLLRESNRL